MIHDTRVSSFTDEYKAQPIIFFPSLFSQNNSSTGRRSGKVTKPPTSNLEMLSSPRQTPRDLYPPLSHSTNFQRKKDIGSGHRLVHWRIDCQTSGVCTEIKPNAISSRQSSTPPKTVTTLCRTAKPATAPTDRASRNNRFKSAPPLLPPTHTLVSNPQSIILSQAIDWLHRPTSSSACLPSNFPL